MNRPKIALLAGFLFLCGLAGTALWLDRPAPAPALSAGALYASSVPDLSGREQVLGQWSQDWLLLNFWATWCGPCREEMPYLAKLPQKYTGRHLKLVGIAADNATKAANFAKEAHIDYSLLADEGRAMELARRLGNQAGALPYTVLIAPGGRIAWVRVGALDAGEAEAALDKMLPK